MNVASDQTIGWVRLSVQASSPGLFDVASVTAISPWQDYGGSAMVGGIDPISGSKGFARNSTFPGSMFAEMEILVAPDSLPGDYTIDPAEIRWAQSPYIEDQAGVSGPSFIVHVVPEPVTSLFLFLSVLLVVLRHR